MLSPGVRVVRGPDWSWGNQDGGEGFVGTLCEVGKAGSVGSPDKTVVVQWDNGTKTNYRVGYLGKYDLKVIDNAQIGVKHPNIVCDGCKSQGIGGMKYICSVCYDYDLCYMCYHGDKHDLEHTFKRFDSATAAGVDLAPRKNARKGELKGIFVGAVVVRGSSWEWGNQDGGDGKTGRVVDIRGWDKESSRSVANVTWQSGSTNVYRLGHKGYRDIKFVEPSSGGSYYPDHLPVLGQNVEQAVLQPARSGPPPFGVGDKVKVVVSEDQLRAMQQGHGGWNPKMAEYIGKIGKVHRVTDKGDIRVQYEGCHNRWTFNPVTLAKVNSVAVGDIVCLRTDVDKVKELQKGHGEWIEIMKNSLGKLGKILKIYSDGDLRVQLDGHAWTLNPLCVRMVPGSATELANTMHASQNQRQEPSMEWHPDQANQGGGTENNQTNGAADQLVRAAAQGHAEAVQRLLGVGVPGLVAATTVDARSGGKTALQVAAHQGHAAIAAILLRAGACVNAADNDGDSCLHYAAFGNQPEVLEMLIKAGSDLNAANRSGCTALHIAAHKQPARCVQILLAAGANPNCTDLYGDTALHDAIGKDSYQVIELLTAAGGIDFTLRNKRGFNVLHHAALKGKNFATKKLLSQTRQLVDVKKDDGFSPLHLAALNGHREVVEILAREGHADIDLRNNRNQTALLLAVSQGHCSVIELLVKLRANINAKDEDGDTALHLVLIKRAHLQSTQDIRSEDSPDIHAIYEAIAQHSVASEHRLAMAIACYLIHEGIDLDALNAKNQHALSLLRDSNLQELLKSYKPIGFDDDGPITYQSGGSPPLPALLQNNQINSQVASSTSSSSSSAAVPQMLPRNQSNIAMVPDSNSANQNQQQNQQNQDQIFGVENFSLRAIDGYNLGGNSNENNGGGNGSPKQQMMQHGGSPIRIVGGPKGDNGNLEGGLKGGLGIGIGTVGVVGGFVDRTRRSRRGGEQKNDKTQDLVGGTSQENSPNHKPGHHYQNDQITNSNISSTATTTTTTTTTTIGGGGGGSSSKPVECLVCSDLSEENVRLEPCHHKPACEDCSSRMKKCLECGCLVQKRITKDGRVIPAKSRQPSAERMRYLECKIAEIEESHACSICMERKRNVVFLCGHGTCSKCADTLKTCHMCRKTITKKIPIY